MAKILLIEDDRFLRSILEKRLKAETHDIMTAVDGEEALQKLITFPADLILLDIILPKRNGFLLLEDIGRDPNLKKVPVFIISNLGQREDIQKGKQLGAVEYFVKATTSLEEMITKINQFLREKKAP